jgi:hypothetical protein
VSMIDLLQRPTAYTHERKLRAHSGKRAFRSQR